MRRAGAYVFAVVAGLALGLGSGLSPKAPGTVGTLWAWASFLVLYPWLEDAGCTAAELDPAAKNARSHRGQAARAMREALRGIA